MIEVTVITDVEKVKKHHEFAEKLIVKEYNGESWTRYLIIDRRKVNAKLRKLKSLAKAKEWVYYYLNPNWSSHYNGPGQIFHMDVFRLVRSNQTGRYFRNKRYIVFSQMGVLDI